MILSVGVFTLYYNIWRLLRFDKKVNKRPMFLAKDQKMP